MKKTIQILILLSLSFFGYAQNKMADLKKAHVFLQKAVEQTDNNNSEALRNANNGILLAEKYADFYLLAKLYYKKGNILDNLFEYDSSYIYYKRAVPYFIDNEDSLFAAKCFNNIGATDYYYGKYDDAIASYKKASNYLEGIDEFELHAKIMNNIGLINKSSGNYKQAIIDFHKSMDFKIKLDDKKGVAFSYQNIGVIYWEQKNYNEALKCFEDAAEIFRKSDDLNDLAGIYTNIGMIYNELKDITKALSYYDKAIVFYKQTNYKQGLATVYLNKGILLENTNHKNDAEALYLESLKLSEEINYALGIFVNKINLSGVYSDKNKHKKAINIIKDAIELDTKEYPVKYVADAYQNLAHSYAKANNYKSANYYLNKYVEIKDSIFNIEKNKQINELHTKYETEKKESEIALLKKDSQIQSLEMDRKDKRIKTTTIILIIIFIFSVISMILYFQKRASYLLLVEQNVKLAKSDIEKESIPKIEKIETAQAIEKYSETNLDESQKKELIDSIIVLMEEEKYYLNTQFTINDFAKELQSNRNYLSQIINEYFNTNFNNFVNEFRVKEARKLLLSHEYENYTIEGIAKTVGFHSKATFNNAFKKFTGVTPSFFKNNTKRL